MMKTIHKDIWRYVPEKYCIVIPINSHVNADGHAAMGFGLAYQARKLYKNLTTSLGTLIKNNGPNVFYLEKQHLILFPTQGFWRDDAKIEIIEQSCEQLVKVLDTFTDIKIAMPKVGCGRGHMKWHEVEPVVEKYLAKYGERVIIVDNESGDCGKEWKGDNV